MQMVQSTTSLKRKMSDCCDEDYCPWDKIDPIFPEEVENDDDIDMDIKLATRMFIKTSDMNNNGRNVMLTREVNKDDYFNDDIVNLEQTGILDFKDLYEICKRCPNVQYMSFYGFRCMKQSDKEVSELFDFMDKPENQVVLEKLKEVRVKFPHPVVLRFIPIGFMISVLQQLFGFLSHINCANIEHLNLTGEWRQLHYIPFGESMTCRSVVDLRVSGLGSFLQKVKKSLKVIWFGPAQDTVVMKILPPLTQPQRIPCNNILLESIQGFLYEPLPFTWLPIFKYQPGLTKIKINFAHITIWSSLSAAIVRSANTLVSLCVHAKPYEFLGRAVGEIAKDPCTQSLYNLDLEPITCCTRLSLLSLDVIGFFVQRPKNPLPPSIQYCSMTLSVWLQIGASHVSVLKRLKYADIHIPRVTVPPQPISRPNDGPVRVSKPKFDLTKTNFFSSLVKVKSLVRIRVISVNTRLSSRGLAEWESTTSDTVIFTQEHDNQQIIELFRSQDTSGAFPGSEVLEDENTNEIESTKNSSSHADVLMPESADSAGYSFCKPQ